MSFLLGAVRIHHHSSYSYGKTKVLELKKIIIIIKITTYLINVKSNYKQNLVFEQEGELGISETCIGLITKLFSTAQNLSCFCQIMISKGLQ